VADLAPDRELPQTRRNGGERRRVMRTKLMLVLAMAFSLSLVGTALAQDNPTEDAYGGVLGEEVSSQGGSGGGAATDESTTPTQAVASPESSGSLPFTGLELGLVVLAGLGLVALGVAMRRGTRGSPRT
jgi:hypothetical protein